MVEHLLPTPKKVEIKEGKINIAYTAKSEYTPWSSYAELCENALKTMYDDLADPGPGAGIRLVKDDSVAPGHYVIDVEEDIAVKASEEEGLCYGLATALQIPEYKYDTFTAERCHIEDWGDKPYRALMLDLVSYWHPLHTVLRLMDVCFFLKIPYVHLHLIDNEACRMPSKAFPKLPNPRYSYSEEDIVTMREYANARGLKLVPEFDIPGHARRLVRSYPEIFRNQLDENAQVEGIKTEVGFAVRTDDVICAGSEKCSEAMKVLFKEVCDLFPESEYIHIGGDEAYIQVWDHCPVCRKYMEEHGIEDRGELYSEYVARISQFVIDQGRTPIVWEGFPRKGAHRIPKQTVVCAWETHYNMPQDLLADGFKIINGSWQPLYIVGNSRRWTPENILDWHVHNWQHWWEHSAATLNPIHLEPTDDVLGAQISLWGTSYEQEINVTMENLGAMSERTWNVKRTVDYTFHRKRTNTVLSKLSRLIMER